MRNFKLKALAVVFAVSALQVAGVANATPSIGAGLNVITSDNFENLYRPVGNCSALNPCLADAANPANGTSFLAPPVGITVPSGANAAPAGWAFANPFTGVPNVIAGDVFAGVFNFNGIQNIGAGINWTPSGGDQLIGYFATEVKNVFGPGVGNDPYDLANAQAHIEFTDASTDPFGILGAGETARLFVDLVNPWNPVESISDQLTDIQTGTVWGSLGMGADTPAPTAIDPDGFGYSHVPLGVQPGSLTGEAFFAMNFIANNTGRLFNPINDLNETELGGTTFPPASGLCNPFAPATCTEFILNVGQLNANQNGWLVAGLSGWGFQSGDDAFLNAIPEPGSLALLALGLLGLAGIGRRTRV